MRKYPFELIRGEYSENPYCRVLSELGPIAIQALAAEPITDEEFCIPEMRSETLAGRGFWTQVEVVLLPQSVWPMTPYHYAPLKAFLSLRFAELCESEHELSIQYPAEGVISADIELARRVATRIPHVLPLPPASTVHIQVHDRSLPDQPDGYLKLV